MKHGPSLCAPSPSNNLSHTRQPLQTCLHKTACRCRWMQRRTACPAPVSAACSAAPIRSPDRDVWSVHARARATRMTWSIAGRSATWYTNTTSPVLRLRTNGNILLCVCWCCKHGVVTAAMNEPAVLELVVERCRERHAMQRRRTRSSASVGLRPAGCSLPVGMGEC